MNSGTATELHYKLTLKVRKLDDKIYTIYIIYSLEVEVLVEIHAEGEDLIGITP